jgi:hypothetical protein
MYLPDTNVVSELRKISSGKADANVAAWAETVSPQELFVSVITIHELELGVRLAERRDERQGAILRAWLNDRVMPAFDGRVLPVDAAVALQSAALHVPDPRPVRDAFIAATALVHKLIVVTRDTGDFGGTGVDVLNPWDERP